MHIKLHGICSLSQIIAAFEDNYMKSNCVIFQSNINTVLVIFSIGTCSDFFKWKIKILMFFKKVRNC